MVRWLFTCCFTFCGMTVFATDRSDEQDLVQTRFNRQQIERSVEKGLQIIDRGATSYLSNQTCFACHHQTLPMLAFKTAREAKMDVNADLFRQQQKFTIESFQSRKTRLVNSDHIGGRAATVGYGLWAMNLTGETPNELTEAMAGYLLSLQQEDGSWQPPSHRPPLESSAVSCTVLVAWGLKSFASESQRDRVKLATERARHWLTSTPLREQEDINFALWGEKLLEGNPMRIQSLRTQSIKAQQPDGGWRQNGLLASDPYATGQTLFVLHEIGIEGEIASIKKGIEFLMSTQNPDGSWHVVTRSKPIQPWFDNGDPHGKDQFISFASTCWATAALARFIENTWHE